MYLHHDIASAYMHSHRLLEYQHVLALVSSVLALLPVLFDGDAVVNNHDHTDESHGHYHQPVLALRHDVAFAGNVPYTPYHHQTTFPHHAVQPEQIQAGYRHFLRYAYHDHHHQKQLLQSVENRSLSLQPWHCESLRHGRSLVLLVHQLFSWQ